MILQMVLVLLLVELVVVVLPEVVLILLLALLVMVVVLVVSAVGLVAVAVLVPTVHLRRLPKRLLQRLRRRWQLHNGRHECLQVWDVCRDRLPARRPTGVVEAAAAAAVVVVQAAIRVGAPHAGARRRGGGGDGAARRRRRMAVVCTLHEHACSVSSVVRKIRYRQRRHSGLLPRRVLRDRRATAAWQTPAAVRTIAKLRYTTRPLQSFPKFQCSDRWASRAQMHAPSLWVSRWSVARP